MSIPQLALLSEVETIEPVITGVEIRIREKYLYGTRLGTYSNLKGLFSIWKRKQNGNHLRLLLTSLICLIATDDIESFMKIGVSLNRELLIFLLYENESIYLLMVFVSRSLLVQVVTASIVNRRSELS